MSNIQEFTPEAGKVTIFSTTWCGYCKRLKSQLERTGVPFNEINIEENEGGAELVREANDGNQTVPTLVFPDGSTATNPSLATVKEKLGLN